MERGKFHVLDIEDMLYDGDRGQGRAPVLLGGVRGGQDLQGRGARAVQAARGRIRDDRRQERPGALVIFERINATAEKDGEGGTLYVGNGRKILVEFFAGDSTGLKPTNRGNWMDQKWGGRKGFVKLHVVVDAKTKRICAKDNHGQGRHAQTQGTDPPGRV